MATLAAFCVFALVTSVTPGPNNLMVLASGVNFGFQRSVPHILGISGGFGVMVFTVGLGLGRVFVELPWLHEVLRWVGGAYLLYLALKIANAGPPAGHDKDAESDSNPMSFLGAAAFQWLNPKAWVMAVGAFSTYVPAAGIGTALAVSALFALINIPSVGVWALFGSRMRLLLSDGRRLRMLNICMSLLLVASLYPLLW